MMKRYDETFEILADAQEFIFEELVDAEDVKHNTIELVKVGDGFRVEWEEF